METYTGRLSFSMKVQQSCMNSRKYNTLSKGTEYFEHLPFKTARGGKKSRTKILL